MSSYCHRCDRWFRHDQALSQHMRDSDKHCYCASCDIEFPSSTNLQRHYSLRHHYCAACDLFFDDSDELLEHGEEEHYACRACDRIFTTFDGYASHNDSAHYYCRDCNRLFQSASALSNHRASSVHTPRSLACPGRLCNKRFTCLSALILHAESNTCRSGVTRKIVNAYVARVDQQNIITNPARMIAGPDGSNYAPAEPEYWATELSWNGVHYECFLCHGQYHTLASLNQHLKSPRHLQSIYHCPMRGCNKEFTVLSALCQHVEMGSCGIRQTKLVQNTIQSLASGMRALTL